jgi:hypothetical protein
MSLSCKREQPALPAVSKSINCCNLCGYSYPAAHEEFSKYAAELLFHTSRYYWIAERYLRKLSGMMDFSLSGYRATRLSEQQRIVMSGLLAQRPSRDSAMGIIDIVNRVKSGRHDVDDQLFQHHGTSVQRFHSALSQA